MRKIIFVTLLFVACSDPPATPIPKIYSWQDCPEDYQATAHVAFMDCLDKVGGVYMHEYLEGQQFTPRNCEQYALTLYCSSQKDRCEKQIVEAVNNCDEAHEGERQQLKSAYDKLTDQFDACKHLQNEWTNCPGYEAFMDKCYKKHQAEAVDAPTTN